MKIEDIIDKKIAVHCDTREKAEKFIKAVETKGIKFKFADSKLCIKKDFAEFNEYKEETCYDIKSYESRGVTTWDYSKLSYYNGTKSLIVSYDRILEFEEVELE